MNPQTLLRVSVNGQAHELPEGATLAELLQRLDLPPTAVATAINGAFVPRESRAAHALRDGDAVTCIQPITGG